MVGGAGGNGGELLEIAVGILLTYFAIRQTDRAIRTVSGASPEVPS